MSGQNHADVEIDIDLTNVDAWGGESRPLVPPGDYKLVVVKAESKTSSGNNPMVVVEFEVAEGEELAGAKAWNNYVLSTSAGQGRLKALMIACGAQLDKIRLGELEGATIRASIVHTEGPPSIDANGNPRPAKTFANICNELPLEDAPAQAAPPQRPPVQNKAGAKPQNTVRRA